MASADNIRCARCTMVVLGVFPNMMQDLFSHDNIPADILCSKVMNNTKLMQTLNLSEFHAVNTLKTDGFSKLDVSLIYKIIKFYNNFFVEPPSRKWGSNPGADETSIGDDIERIRIWRNMVVHKTDAQISETKFNDFFKIFIEVGKRIDTYLDKPADAGFLKTIEEYQTCSLNEEMIAKQLQAQKEEECLEEKTRIVVEGREVRVYLGKTAQEIIENRVDDTDIPMKLIIYGVDDSGNAIPVLNANMADLCSSNICFKGAEECCIILHVVMKNTLFQNENLFLNESSAFIKKVFTIADIKFSNDEATTVIVIPDGDVVQEEELTEDREDERFEDATLVLNVDIKTKVFQSADELHQTFDNFFGKIFTMGNGKEILKGKALSAVLVTDECDPYQGNVAQAVVSKQQLEVFTGISPEEENYLRIIHLIVKVAPTAMRVRFDEEFHPDRLKTILFESRNNIIQPLNRKRVIKNAQMKVLFPESGNPCSETFDMDLMIILIRNLTNIEVSNSLPYNTVKSIGADLSRLKYYRFQCLHTEDSFWSDSTFDHYWDEISQAIIRLGGWRYTDRCKDLKACKLVGNDEKRTKETKSVGYHSKEHFLSSRHQYQGTDAQVVVPKPQIEVLTGISLEDENYLRTVHLFRTVASRVVRVKFDMEFHPSMLRTFLNRNRLVTFEPLRQKRVISNYQWGLLYPNSGNPNSETFDVSLMVCLIRNLTYIPIEDYLPPLFDQSDSADLTRLWYYQRKIKHGDADIFLHQTFEVIWDDICQAMIRIGGASFAEECSLLKTCSLESNKKIAKRIKENS